MRLARLAGMTAKRNEPPDREPPSPPPFERKVAFGRLELIGVPLMAVIPLAALTGLLGQRPGATMVTAPPLELRIKYPEVVRYKTTMPLEVAVSNTGSVRLSDVSVQIDRAYLSRFANVQTTPPVEEVTGRHYKVALPDLQPGETRQVMATLEAAERGRHGGTVVVALGHQPAIEAALTTTVLP
jgi:hypothetical protein